MRQEAAQVFGGIELFCKFYNLIFQYVFNKAYRSCHFIDGAMRLVICTNVHFVESKHTIEHMTW